MKETEQSKAQMEEWERIRASDLRALRLLREARDREMGEIEAGMPTDLSCSLARVALYTQTIEIVAISDLLASGLTLTARPG